MSHFVIMCQYLFVYWFNLQIIAIHNSQLTVVSNSGHGFINMNRLIDRLDNLQI